VNIEGITSENSGIKILAAGYRYIPSKLFLVIPAFTEQHVRCVPSGD